MKQNRINESQLIENARVVEKFFIKMPKSSLKLVEYHKYECIELKLINLNKIDKNSIKN